MNQELNNQIKALKTVNENILAKNLLAIEYAQLNMPKITFLEDKLVIREKDVEFTYLQNDKGILEIHVEPLGGEYLFCSNSYTVPYYISEKKIVELTL